MEKEILDPRAFKEIRRMNAAFLGLLYHCHGTPMASRLDGRSGLLGLIVSLTPAEAKTLCTARAALFSLQLDGSEAPPHGVAEEAQATETTASRIEDPRPATVGRDHRVIADVGFDRAVKVQVRQRQADARRRPAARRTGDKDHFCIVVRIQVHAAD